MRRPIIDTQKTPRQEEPAFLKPPVPEKSRSQVFLEWLGIGKGDGKTRLDLLQVLAALSIPVVVVVMASIFTASQSSSQQQAEEQRAQAQRDAEEQRAQDQALQAYFEEMGNLLLDENLRTSQEDDDTSTDEASTLARARTLTILGRVNPERKKSVVQFLYESNLIQKNQPIVSLDSADLRYADLEDNLNEADLRGADLSEAKLSYADLRGAILSEAKLAYADLENANLDGADLRGAKLHEAKLNVADLGGADLRGAILYEANLTYAKNITNEELEQQAQTLKKATMPNGSTHD